MANFEKRSSFDKNANFKSVVIGAGSKVLEVEMNEMQDIWFHSYQKLIKDYFGEGVMNVGKYTFAGGILTIENESMIVNGYLIDVTKLSIPMEVEDFAYLKVWEEDVTFSTPLIPYQGNVQETKAITNYIMDDRVAEETSRRTQVQYDLVASPKILVNTDTTFYLKVGRLTADEGFVISAKILGYNDTKFAETIKLKDSQSVITFSAPYSYGRNSLQVFLDGKLLVPAIDYFEVDSSTIRLANTVIVTEGQVLYATSDHYVKPMTTTGHAESHSAWGDDPIDITDLKDVEGLIPKLRALTGELDIDCGGFTDAYLDVSNDYEYSGGTFAPKPNVPQPDDPVTE
nr:MAG TPA: protein of unknown function (DUF4815) [Caudoviricetes sp.]